jgi:hypothetical protein
MEHVRTQLPYALPAIFTCLIVYLFSGLLYQQSLLIRYFIPLIAGFIFCIALLQVCNRKK